jgi:LysR family transcriptional regulator, hca operon transcriptional activator
MELRHLRYFVAVAEEGSLTVAARKRLHTVQPSLSRQIRDLEYEVGVPLLTRSVHGVELTAAGRAFLDHARLTLTQAEAATEAARRAAQPSKQVFAMGFLTGQEVDWLPRATSLLRDELANIEIRISSDHSATLADELVHGRLDVAFLRAEQLPDLGIKVVAKEPLVAILPSDHRLAQHKAVDPHDLRGETYIGVSKVPRVLRSIIADYFKRHKIEIVPSLEVDNYAMAISLVASTRGVALLPASARNFLPWSVVSRPLKGEAPTIDLAVGYHRANTSPILKSFLSRMDELIAARSGKATRLSRTKSVFGH